MTMLFLITGSVAALGNIKKREKLKTSHSRSLQNLPGCKDTHQHKHHLVTANLAHWRRKNFSGLHNFLKLQISSYDDEEKSTFAGKRWKKATLLGKQRESPDFMKKDDESFPHHCVWLRCSTLETSQDSTRFVKIIKSTYSHQLYLHFKEKSAQCLTLIHSFWTRHKKNKVLLHLPFFKKKENSLLDHLFEKEIFWQQSVTSALPL